ncbi:MAG: hypothetical protein J5742_01495 [Alphaproteobacteria bacterium]|nr:hypothetical protein [Alphaproteobacteria bacterium]
MFDKKAFIGIVAVTLCAQSALGAASVRTVGGQNATTSTAARAGSLRANPTKTASSATSQPSLSQSYSSSSADTSRLATAYAPSIGIKTNKLVSSTSSTGLALDELERRINELSGEVEEKLDTGEFESAFDTRAEQRQLADQPYVRDYVDTSSPDLSSYATKEFATEKATTAQRSAETTAKSYTDEKSATVQRAAEANAKSYADTTFATKTNTYTKAEVDAKIPDEVDLSNYYTKSQVYNKGEVEAMIPDDVDLSNYYTKSQSDGRYAAAGSSYTKSESDAKYPAASNVYTKSQVYTKAEVDSLTPNVDLSNYYNKSEVDDKIDDAITGGQVDLSNYYKKSETYSKTEANNLLSSKLDSTTAASTYETKGTAYSKSQTDNLLSGKLCANPDFSVQHTEGATTATVTVKCNNVTQGSFVVPVGSGTGGGEACGVTMTKTALKQDTTDPTKITGYRLQFKDCNGQSVGDPIDINHGVDGADGQDAEAPDPCEPVFTTAQITEGTRTGFQITMKSSCNPSATGKTFKIYNGEQGAAGTGIEYQGIVANCTELKTHNGAPQGHAWYKADNKLMYISDGTSTSFNDCPNGGVDFQGQPGTDGCSPTLDISDKVSGCYTVTLTPFSLNSSGVCAPGTAITRQLCDSDPSCAPVAQMVTNRDATKKCKTLSIQKMKWNKTAQRCDEDGDPTSTPVCEPCPATKIVDSAPKTNGCIDRTTTQYTFNETTQQCDESSTTVERCPIPSCPAVAQMVQDRALSQCTIFRVQKQKLNASKQCVDDGDPTDTPICDPCPAPVITKNLKTNGCYDLVTTSYTLNSTTHQCDASTSTVEHCPCPTVAQIVTNRDSTKCRVLKVTPQKLNSSNQCVDDESASTETQICDSCPAPEITYSEPNATTGCRTRTTKTYTLNATTHQCDASTSTFQECPIQPLHACAASVAIENVRAGGTVCKQLSVQERTYNPTTQKCEDADTDPQVTTLCDSCPASTTTQGNLKSNGCYDITTTNYAYNSSTNQCDATTSTKEVCNGHAIACATAISAVETTRGDAGQTRTKCYQITTQAQKVNSAGTACVPDGDEVVTNICDGQDGVTPTVSFRTETDSEGKVHIISSVNNVEQEIGTIEKPTLASACPAGTHLATETRQESGSTRANITLVCVED